jgi:hypothetical protein
VKDGGGDNDSSSTVVKIVGAAGRKEEDEGWEKKGRAKAESLRHGIVIDLGEASENMGLDEMESEPQAQETRKRVKPNLVPGATSAFVKLGVVGDLTTKSEKREGN